MVKKNVRETIFFVSLFFFFYLMVLARDFYERKGMNPTISTLIAAGIYTAIAVGVFFLAKLNDSIDSYRAFEISPGALCKGGVYMHQGDSPEAQMCRAMAQTPEGRNELAAYNCPTGYIGQPGRQFVYSSDSNDNWKSDKCTDKPKCVGSGNSTCSMGWD